MNSGLGKALKKKSLFWSKVAASLRQALLVDALVETSYLNTPYPPPPPTPRQSGWNATCKIYPWASIAWKLFGIDFSGVLTDRDGKTPCLQFISPTVMKFGTVIPLRQKIRKSYKSRFSPEIGNFRYIERYRKIALWYIFSIFFFWLLLTLLGLF